VIHSSLQEEPHCSWFSGYLFKDVLRPLLIRVKTGAEKIGKEKQLEHGKHDEKLDEDDFPQGFAHRHGGKTVPIKPINLNKQRTHV
jgi:hypothetical protein